MKTYTTLKSLFTSLSQNTSTQNTSLSGQLINDQVRYTIQKYFDNLQTSITTTVGAMDLTITGSMAVNAVSATLSAAWTYPTATQLVNFSSGEQRSVLFTLNSTAITWTAALTETATTAISTTGVQSYNIPQNISKIKDMTVSVGQLKFTPAPILTQVDWDNVNFLPYTSDIPQYYYIYNNQLSIFPIPSTTGNIITFNYKTRVADMSYEDYSTGTLAASGMVVGSTAVVGTTTDWLVGGTYPAGVDLTYLNLFIRATPPKGDGIWYQIRSFTDATHLTLVNPVINAPSISGASYTIGQIPLLSEDFHDMLVYGALKTYYATIVSDDAKFKEHNALYTDRLELLAEYAGTRQVNVDLGTQPNPINPNLFIYNN